MLYYLLAAAKIDLNGLPQAPTDQSEVKVILQVLFGIIGALALLFISISGLRYVISAGDPQDTAKAKKGIIYALAGLALAITAEVIVTWVVTNI